MARSRKYLGFTVCGLFLLGTFGLIASYLLGSYLIAPSPATVDLPERFKANEVSFASSSGAELKGNLLRGQPGKGVVILMHGVRSHRGAMVQHAELLSRHGFSVFLFDFQAHGESSGTHITSGYLEAMDAAAAVEFLGKHTPDEKIAILGVSLGGAAAVLATPPLPVQAMVLELVYADIERAVKNRIAFKLGSWARIFSPLLTWQMEVRLGISPDQLSPEKSIAQVTCPKLIIAGAKDRHTLLADTEALFAAAPAPKELWVISNAVHEDIYRVAREEYEERILAFLNAQLSPAPQP